MCRVGTTETLALEHHTRAIIHLDRLRANLHAIRARLPSRTRVYAVVKADAYGHGMVAVSQALERTQVDGFVVGSTAEGAELRRHGIAGPILVLGPLLPSEADDLVAQRLTASVSTPELARALAAAARAARRTVPIHVRIDLGLAGMGVQADTAPGFLRWLSGLDGVQAQGLFAHTVGAYRNDAALVQSERDRFRRLLDELTAEQLRPKIVHALSSPGLTMDGCESHDGVRLGSLLYGIRMTDGSLPGVRPIIEIRSRLLEISAVPAGTALAYERNGDCAGPMRVGIVPFGFAQAPYMGQAGSISVLIRGRRLPMVGRAFMNMMLVDLSAAPDVAPGDEVVIVGQDGAEEITVEEVARCAGIRPSAVALLGPGLTRQHHDFGTDSVAPREDALPGVA